MSRGPGASFLTDSKVKRALESVMPESGLCYVVNSWCQAWGQCLCAAACQNVTLFTNASPC